MTTTLRFPISKVGAALGALVLALAAPLAWAQAKNAVESVNFATVQGGKIQVKVGMKEPLAAAPQGFSVTNPPRIAIDLPDPFKPRKLAPPKEGAGGGIAPDLNRRKEPLEAFPLEQLKMVGTLSQGKDTYAIVRADKTLYRVKKGNYMGQNFGLITEVTEGEIKLKEIVQDSAGDWAERQSVLPLLEEAGKGDRK